MADPREPLGRLVRETWLAWARLEPAPKPSWLLPWELLDDGQREVDMRIGEAVAAVVREQVARDIEAADWKTEPIPDKVTRLYPGATGWEWTSPLRLRADHGIIDGAAWLVVVDAGRTHAMGQGVGAANALDPGYIRDTYASLRMSLMSDIGHRDACQDGTPVCREGESRCVWCGIAADEHGVKAATDA